MRWDKPIERRGASLCPASIEVLDGREGLATHQRVRRTPYQRLGLHLQLSIEPSWHVYGPVVPPGYTALGIAVRSEPEGVRAGDIGWPATAPFHIQGLTEEFSVYTGMIEIVAPLEFILPRNSGVARVEIRVTFQTCNATECLPPNAIEVVLAVPEAPAP